MRAWSTSSAARDAYRLCDLISWANGSSLMMAYVVACWLAAGPSRNQKVDVFVYCIRYLGTVQGKSGDGRLSLGQGSSVAPPD